MLSPNHGEHLNKYIPDPAIFLRPFSFIVRNKKKSAPLLWDQVSHVGRKNSRSQEGETLKEQIKEHKNPKFVQISNPLKAIFTYIFPISNYIPKHKLCLFLFSNSQFHFSKSNLKKISRHDLAAICSVFPLQ